MSNFESVFVPASSASVPTSIARMKMGEIFHVNKTVYAFICIHCSREFQQFADFAVHVQEHLVNVARQYHSTVKNECIEYAYDDFHHKRLDIELPQTDKRDIYTH